MGHLHIDHAGGLERFMDTNVPIYVHEEEFKHACWAVGTKMDYGVYLVRPISYPRLHTYTCDHLTRFVQPDYMDLGRLNWKTFCGQQIELFQGLTMHHCPGHTPGLCAMQLNLASSGTFLFTTDQFHVKENYEDGQPQGWLARDHNAWFRSFQLIEQLKRNFSATLVFGHDKEVFEEIVASRGSSME
jgi:glyoxylase-like metal-dependent hydrolase (beta-lactamase superfamily II)